MIIAPPPQDPPGQVQTVQGVTLVLKPCVLVNPATGVKMGDACIVPEKPPLAEMTIKCPNETYSVTRPSSQLQKTHFRCDAEGYVTHDPYLEKGVAKPGRPKRPHPVRTRLHQRSLKLGAATTAEDQATNTLGVGTILYQDPPGEVLTVVRPRTPYDGHAQTVVGSPSGPSTYTCITPGCATATIVPAQRDDRYRPRVQECWTPLSERPPKGYEYRGGCVWSPTPDVDRLGAKIFSSVSSLATYLTSSTLLFSVPPCGTAEAKTADACIQWKVMPCPTFPASDRPGDVWVSIQAKPIGCP